ncbi:hypothetical protein F5Y17DRAFT_471536 [Xylariaceae sp. FL0594]|nr:hypothetical protein F5Y17DRAFT_471536 [Xylariaceae sp. FL0594]
MSDDTGAELQRLWDDAVVEYLKETGNESSMDEWRSLVINNDELDRQIDESFSDFSQYRSRNRKLRGVFRAVVTPLQLVGAVAQEGLALTFAPAAVIVKAGLFLVKSSTKVTEIYDVIEELFEKIRGITDRLSEYLQGGIDPKLKKVAISLLRSMLRVFGVAQVAIKRGRFKEMMRGVFKDDDTVHAALKALEDTFEDELRLVAARTYRTTRRIDERAEAGQNRELLRQALYTDAYRYNEAFHNDIESSRLPCSGDWLLDHELFDSWARMEIPVLESMNTQHTPEIILKTVAYKMTNLCEPYREMAVSACSDDDKLFGHSSLWASLFIDPFNTEKMLRDPLYLVIDGLDEATLENQELIVRMAKSLADSRSRKSKTPAIQLLLLGRPELEYNVSNAWSGERSRPKMLHLSPSLSKTDVERYVRRGVRQDIPLLAKMRQKRPGQTKRLEREIVKTLCDSADGMFMLARLMLAEIRNMNKPELIQEALSRPPGGLDDMFRRVIARLSVMGGFDKKDLNEIITWVAFAKRDLLLGELDLILKLRDSRQNGIVDLEEELKTRFGSFFSVSHDEEEASEGRGSETVVDSIVQDRSALSVAGINDGSHADDESDSDDDNQDVAEDVLDDYEDGDDVDDEEESGEDEDEDEDETDEMVPDSFDKATVKFGHASIAQHFRTAPFHEGIGVDIESAQTRIALTCAQVLTGNIPKRNGKPWRQPDLSDYAADHLLDHLAEIQTGSAGFAELADEMAVLFGDPSLLLSWFRSVSRQREFMCQLSGDEDSSTHLLRPFAKAVAQAWLEWNSLDEMLAVMFLYGYDSLAAANGSAQWTLHPSRPYEHIAKLIPPEDIQKWASLCWPTDGGRLHLALGKAFMKIETRRHAEAALEELQEAPLRSDDPQVKREAYVRACGELLSLEKYRELIALVSQARECLRADDEYSETVMVCAFAAYVELDEIEAAYEAAKEFRQFAPDSAMVLYGSIFISYRAQRYAEVVEAVESALADETSGLGRLNVLLWLDDEAQDYIMDSFTKCGRQDAIRRALVRISARAEEAQDIFMLANAEATLGRLHYRLYQDEQKAVSIWEGLIEEHIGSPGAASASFQLASLYFTNAVKGGAQDAETWISKLEKLAESWKGYGDGSSDDLQQNVGEYATALAGRWPVRQGKSDMARDKVLPLLRLAIRNLTDTVSGNDRAGCLRLGKAFTCFGDRQNADIAYALGLPLHKSKHLLEAEVEATGNDGTDDGLSPPGADAQVDAGQDEIFSIMYDFVCSGGCGRRWTSFRSLATCEICWDVYFCHNCLPRLQNNTFEFRVCDPTHPKNPIYPSRGLIRKGPDEHIVRVGEDKEMSVSDWIAGIKKEWLG